MFADREFKMAAMTRLSLTLNPMGISHFHLFFIMDHGSHVGFQISTKNTNLVVDHPMNISGKFG
jgi:hypothetical protein